MCCKAEFAASLLQSFVSHDPEVNIWFITCDTFKHVFKIEIFVTMYTTVQTFGVSIFFFPFNLFSISLFFFSQKRHLFSEDVCFYWETHRQ